MSYSIPPSPPNFKGNTYNPASYPSTNNTGLTVQGGLSYFVSYPLAQGKVTLLDTNVTGNLRTSDNIFLDNSGNYIQFADGTKQTTATQDFSGYAFTDVSNNFSKLNTFNGNIAIGGILNTNYLQFPDGSKQYSAPTDDINTVYNDISNTFLNGTIQTFTGNNNSAGLKSPFVIKNYDNGDSGSLYLDPSGNYDITLFSNQSSNAGLTVRSPSYSFTINPTSGNIATFLNPISSIYSITGLSFNTGSTVITQSPSFNPSICSFSNSYSGALNPQFYFQMQDVSLNYFSPCQITNTTINFSRDLNLNNNDINNCNSINSSTNLNLNSFSNYNKNIVINDNSYQIANTNYVNAFKTFYRQATVAITTSSVFFDISNTNTSIAMTWIQPNLYSGVGYYYLNTILYPASYIVFFNTTKTSFNMSITPAINFSQSATSNITKTIPAFNNKTLTFISIQISISPTSITFTNSAGFQSANWYTFDLTVINNYLLLGGSP
jgi:hypothetical protein